MENEEWRDIPGYEGIYMASDIGRVRSLKFGKELLLKPCVGATGYFVAALRKDRAPKLFKVHVLIAMAFLDHKPDGTHRICVDHINNNRLDNRLVNLQLISARENSSKDRRGGTSKYIGVSWLKCGKKWQSRIRINGKDKYLGLFTDELEAADAYQVELANL